MSDAAALRPRAVLLVDDAPTDRSAERLDVPRTLPRRAAAAIRAMMRRNSGVAVYLVAPLVAAVAVASWHTPGRFVAAGDIGPFLREGLAGDVRGLWGYGLTGGGSATTEVARLPELLAFRLAGWLGLAPELGQLGFYWAWLTAASAASISLARQVVPSRAAQAAVGALAIANPLMAVNLPNPLVPAALCTLGLVAGALLRVLRGGGSVRATVLATLPASYLIINPPTLAVVAAVTVLAVLAALGFSPAARGRLARHLAAAVPVSLVAHLWWIVPAIVVFGSGAGASVSAVTDPEAWSWTQVNNSLGNVTTLTANWGWGMHEYLPFSQDLDRLPMSPLRWGLPALALLAPAVAATRPRRRAALAALATSVTCVLIAKGLHDPLPGVNVWLYRSVPGMWLLREPMSKVGPVLLLAYLASAAIAIDGIAARARRADVRGRALARSGLATLVGAALLFGSPVLTGGVAPTDRTPLPSSRVAVPEGWYDLAAEVNADPDAGKALVLPTLPFYQATTTWGFHGVATLPRDLLRRPTLLSLPGGYFADDGVLSGLVQVIAEEADPARLARALDALGVSHVIVRTDLSAAQAVRPVADPGGLIDRLERSQLFGPARDFGVARVLRYELAGGGVSVHPSVATVSAASPTGAARAVASLPATTAGVAEDVGVDTTSVVLDGDSAELAASVHIDTAGWYAIDASPHAGITALASVGPGGVTVDAGLDLRIDGDPIATSAPVPVSGASGPAPLALLVDGTPTALSGEATVLDLVRGSRIQVLVQQGPPEAVTHWSPVRDCNSAGGGAPDLRAERSGGDVALFAAAHSACVTAPLRQTGLALLRIDAQVVEGRTARACVWSDLEARCVWQRTIEASPGESTEVVDVVDLPTDAELFVYADAGPEPAATRYRGVELVPLAAEAATSNVAGLPTTRIRLDEGMHRLTLSRVTSAALEQSRVGVPSPVGDCNARNEDTRLSAERRGDTIRLSADADAACVHFPLASLAPGMAYDVGFEYRTRSTGPARWCLWLDGPDRCAGETQSLPASPAWTTHREQIRIPAGTEGARLFVYADGDRSGVGEPTVNEYRRLSVRLAAPLTVTISRAGARDAPTNGPEAQALHAAPHGGGLWSMEVKGAGAPFVVALPDTADERWTLEGLPEGASATPTVVDGYRQAWVIRDLDGTASLSARYGPSRWAQGARIVSALLIAGLVLQGWRRRPRGRHRARPRPRIP